MTETNRLQIQVDKAVTDLRESYEKTLETVNVLKNETTDNADKLDTFTDFLILETARDKKRYESLERECKLESFEPARLKDLKTLCDQKEQLAKDLLCYSLGRLRRPKPAAQSQ